jgi:hypothetical protein
MTPETEVVQYAGERRSIASALASASELRTFVAWLVVTAAVLAACFPVVKIALLAVTLLSPVVLAVIAVALVIHDGRADRSGEGG